MTRIALRHAQRVTTARMQIRLAAKMILGFVINVSVIQTVSQSLDFRNVSRALAKNVYLMMTARNGRLQSAIQINAPVAQMMQSASL